jgi:hypothetical protein
MNVYKILAAGIPQETFAATFQPETPFLYQSVLPYIDFQRKDFKPFIQAAFVGDPTNTAVSSEAGNSALTIIATEHFVFKYLRHGGSFSKQLLNACIETWIGRFMRYYLIPSPEVAILHVRADEKLLLSVKNRARNKRIEKA